MKIATWNVRPHGRRRSGGARRRERHPLLRWALLRAGYDLPVIRVGDFNQTVAGSLSGGSAERRAMLGGALRSLGYTAWNGIAAHASEGLCAVDLICGPSGRPILAQGRIDLRLGEAVMSDHAGYWIES